MGPPLKRALQRLIEDAVSEEILKKTCSRRYHLIEGQMEQIVVQKKNRAAGDIRTTVQDGQWQSKICNTRNGQEDRFRPFNINER